ncbi:hypothetical protein K440DRAFT_629421 [Wilcoxina mikolae CBS 423.85]|nr:hypothetical protein K440DRAFT_629421 [Wilcoxina mikolae CBS 423.85]
MTTAKIESLSLCLCDRVSTAVYLNLPQYILCMHYVSCVFAAVYLPPRIQWCILSSAVYYPPLCIRIRNGVYISIHRCVSGFAIWYPPLCTCRCVSCLSESTVTLPLPVCIH